MICQFIQLPSAWNLCFNSDPSPEIQTLAPDFFSAWWWRRRCSPSVSGMIPTFLVLLVPFEVCGAVWTHQIHQSQKVFGAGHIPMVCADFGTDFRHPPPKPWFLAHGPSCCQLSTDIPIYLAEMVWHVREKSHVIDDSHGFPWSKVGIVCRMFRRAMLEPRLGPLGWLHSARGDFRWTHRRPRTDGCFSQERSTLKSNDSNH